MKTQKTILRTVSMLLALSLSMAFGKNPYQAQWTNLEGKPISLFHDKKPVLFDFWASWCVPCRASIPSLNQIAQKIPGLNVVGVNADDPGDLEMARKFIKKTGMSYPSILDIPDKISEPLEVDVLPTLILIDTDGKELGRWIGEPENFQEILTKLIQKK
jgi:thiol-disulfide isomerase/thioredoxin